MATNINMPVPLLAAYGAANINISMPSAQMFMGAGGLVDISAPSALVSCIGHNNAGENAAYISLGVPTLSSYGGANAKLALPKPTLATTATFQGFGIANIETQLPVITSSGSVMGVGAAGMAMPMPKLVGYFGGVVSITLTGSPTVVATGISGAVGNAAITLPLYDLTASATTQNGGAALLTMPSARLVSGALTWLTAPKMQLTAIGTAVVTVAYEAYALNLKHNPTPGVEPVDELTHYTNYPFDKIVRYKNSYFGVSGTGLFLLEGTTDYAPTPTAIPWSFKTALTDFKSIQKKNVSMVYFGGRMGPGADITVDVGEASVAPYTFTTPRGATAQNYRQPLGAGLKSRYYAFGASGSDEFSLDSLSINVAVLARKV